MGISQMPKKGTKHLNPSIIGGNGAGDAQHAR
jgi:hypothetical protein